MRKILFIVNPISGTVKKDNIESLIKSSFTKREFDCSIVFTEYAGHASVICKEYLQQKFDTIVAVGGDGSVNEIAKILVGTEVKLGIIPAGSGNGLAHHLKIPINVKKAIGLIVKNYAIKIDTGSINENMFVSIAGIGFDGFVAKKFKGKGKRGFLAYAKIVAEEYPFYKPKKYRIEVNETIIKTRALFISFANSDRFGYQAFIAPEAKIDDGLLDVIIVQKPMIIEIPLLASLLYWRKTELTKQIQYIKATDIKVSSKKSRWINVDGESMKLGENLHVKVHPQSLNIIVP